jgi:hypothetical protein
MSCYIEKMRDALVGMIVVLLLSIPLWGAVALSDGVVQRERVAKFARRQELAITVGNGQQVIGYLATTRRWRVFGLAAGLVLSVAWFLPNVTVNSLYLFAGWFVGALIAEFRVARLPHRPTPAALITPRRLADYLSTTARLMLPGATALCLVVGAFTRDLLWTVAGVTIALVVWLIQRHVLRRPQPLAEPDRIKADDAIRSRSLHVLAGGGATLVLYCVIGQLGGNLLLGVIVPVLGYAAATQVWHVARVH